MAWERRGTKRYYYSASRRDGQVVKTYHGRGGCGTMTAALVERSKRARAGEAADLAAEATRLGPADWAMEGLDTACRLMLEAALYAAGYHKHNYAWRKRRGRPEGRGVADGRRPGG